MRRATNANLFFWVYVLWWKFAFNEVKDWAFSAYTMTFIASIFFQYIFYYILHRKCQEIMIAVNNGNTVSQQFWFKSSNIIFLFNKLISLPVKYFIFTFISELFCIITEWILIRKKIHSKFTFLHALFLLDFRQYKVSYSKDIFLVSKNFIFGILD